MPELVRLLTKIDLIEESLFATSHPLDRILAFGSEANQGRATVRGVGAKSREVELEKRVDQGLDVLPGLNLLRQLELQGDGTRESLPKVRIPALSRTPRVRASPQPSILHKREAFPRAFAA